MIVFVIATTDKRVRAFNVGTDPVKACDLAAAIALSHPPETLEWGSVVNVEEVECSKPSSQSFFSSQFPSSAH